jgi:hypothetical protein
MLKLLSENQYWLSFSFVTEMEDDEVSIVVINKKWYLNPQNYSSVIGYWYPDFKNVQETVENGSYIKDLIDEFFRNLDKSK